MIIDGETCIELGKLLLLYGILSATQLIQHNLVKPWQNAGQDFQNGRKEEEFWRTKSRILWLQVGDCNTAFFHAKTKQRRSLNRIKCIHDTLARLTMKMQISNSI